MTTCMSNASINSSTSCPIEFSHEGLAPLRRLIHVPSTKLPAGTRSQLKRTALAFLLSTLSGCAVHNTVADDDRTPSAQLASEVSASCATICDWAVQCPAPTCNCSGDDCSCAKRPDPVSCPSECAKSMAKFQGHGDVCARVGLNFLSCLSSPDCANLYRNALCAPSEEALSSCASDESSDVGPSVGGAPATTDPGTGRAAAPAPSVRRCTATSARAGESRDRAISGAAPWLANKRTRAATMGILTTPCA